MLLSIPVLPLELSESGANYALDHTSSTHADVKAFAAYTKGSQPMMNHSHATGTAFGQQGTTPMTGNGTWAYSNPLFLPSAPAPTRTSHSPSSGAISIDGKQTAGTGGLTSMNSTSSSFGTTPESLSGWQLPQTQVQPQAGPSKYPDPWFSTTAYPPINLNTGNRFSQLLEEKLGKEKLRNSTYQDGFANNGTPQFDFSMFDNFLQTSWQSQPAQIDFSAQGMPVNAAAQNQAGLYNNQLLAVETALHDLSQVMIPPDLVAPIPPGLFGAQEMDCFPSFPPPPIPSALPVPNASFAQKSPAVSKRNSPVPAKATPPTSRPIPSGPFTWQMSAKEYGESLPPLLKIRVHGNDSPNSGGSSIAPPPPPIQQPTIPGGWAVNLIADPSAAWPGNSPATSSVATPRFASAKIPTPPPSAEVNNSRKRRRTTSTDPHSSPEHERASVLASVSGQGSSSPPESPKAANSSAETGADGEEKKVVIACYNCRAKKLRCDGDKPKCHHCKRRGEDKCEYDSKLRRRGPGKKNKPKQKGQPDAPTIPPPQATSLHTAPPAAAASHYSMGGPLPLGMMPREPSRLGGVHGPGMADGLLMRRGWGGSFFT